MEWIDLHVHSTYSDGTLSPAALVELAKRTGLRAIAITDHDTAAGVAEAVAQGTRTGMEVVPGIEISSWYTSVPLHILGYWFRPGDALLQQRLHLLQDGRQTRNDRILEKLNRLGIEVSAAELQAYSDGGQIGRPHIAQMLVDKGIVRSAEEAFVRFLRRGAAAYADRFKYYAGEAINMIKEAGGIAVLAHPVLLDASLASIPALLKGLQRQGLDGVEVYYPTHSKKAVKTLTSLAEKLGLLATGGSDFHGNARSRTPLGGEAGSRVPSILLEKLRAAKAKEHSERRTA